MSALTRNVVLSAATVLGSAGTLICCVLPAVFVALGAVPQLVWLSEHKPLVFSIALALLVASGGATWYSRSLPCPADPSAAQACQRLRRLNAVLYGVAWLLFSVGLTFAFVLPRLT